MAAEEPGLFANPGKRGINPAALWENHSDRFRQAYARAEAVTLNRGE